MKSSTLKAQAKNISGCICFAAACLFLSACGGGSDSSSPALGSPSPPTTSPPPPDNSQALASGELVQVFGKTEVLVGESVGFAVKAFSGGVSLSWQQTSGPELSFLAKGSKTIGFDVPSSGTYSLLLTASEGTQSEQFQIDFQASQSQDTFVNARLDHSVTELGKVSLHVDVSPSKTIESVQWEQLSGPAIQNRSEQSAFLFFDAPSVTQDELIELEAIVQFDDGTRSSDTVYVLVDDTEFDTNGLFYTNNFIITEDMRAYKNDSPFKNALERCVYANLIPARPTCDFNTLPLIGMQTSSPTIEDVLNRTLVSHPWMGESFESYLRSSAAGPDMLNLLRGVTAVVISYDVRPSFYWVATGAIYLDANNFWQTPQQRDTLNDIPDFRSDFGSELNFSVFWRYTKDNAYYPSTRYAKTERTRRSFEDLEASISWLMYHELAHANDFFPPSSWQSIARTLTPLSYFQSNNASSEQLASRYPLRSSEMHALANVSFGGQTPTSVQVNYRGEDIERFFTPDIASSYYSYYTIREDFATLVERFMMLYRLDAEADIAIIDGESENDFNVIWGQRNRINASAIQQRTAFAVERVYPELGSVLDLQSSLPAPIDMDPNNGWFGNLTISPSSNGIKARTTSSTRSVDFDKKIYVKQDQHRPHQDRPRLP